MSVISIYGVASQKIILKINVTIKEFELNLLELLQKYNLPIASSCQGQGVCQKCIFNDDKLLCEYKVKDFVKNPIQINIKYL